MSLREDVQMLEWLRKLFRGDVPAESSVKTENAATAGMITRTCRNCGKTFTLPENVQYWPDYCQTCRAKIRPVETIRRKCRRCGKEFTFVSSINPWPVCCDNCAGKGKKRS
ncbi:MAG: hypothetical protein IJ242_14460 [Clostridia bacterium]|nr:hypothetical protein [Clostridia bacterium]